MTTTTAGKHQERPLVNGKPIRLRMPQSLLWKAIFAFLFAAVVAGGYFLILQVHWYVHIGGLYWRGFDLKPHWDNWNPMPRLGQWKLFRHAYRDQGEPALATMAVLTLAAARRWWGVRVGKVRLLTAPAVLVVLAFVLITGTTWLLYYGLPFAWAHVGLPTGLTGAAPAVQHVWAVTETLIAGFLVGRVLHRFWAPVGAHIQGVFIDGSVYRYQQGRNLMHSVLGTSMGMPLWVREPLAPPEIRERWSAQSQHPVEKGGRLDRGLVITTVIVLVILAAAGITGHFAVGVMGLHVPYLAP